MKVKNHDIIKLIKVQDTLKGVDKEYYSPVNTSSGEAADLIEDFINIYPWWHKNLATYMEENISNKTYQLILKCYQRVYKLSDAVTSDVVNSPWEAKQILLLAREYLIANPDTNIGFDIIDFEDAIKNKRIKSNQVSKELRAKHTTNKATRQLNNLVQKHYGQLKSSWQNDQGDSIGYGYYHPINKNWGCWGFKILSMAKAYDSLDMDLYDRGYTTSANEKAQERFFKLDPDPYSDHNAVVVYAQNNNNQARIDISSGSPFIILHRTHLRIRFITSKDVEAIKKIIQDGKPGFDNKAAGKWYASYAFTPQYAKKHAKQINKKKQARKNKKIAKKSRHTRYLNHLGAKHSKKTMKKLADEFVRIITPNEADINASPGNINRPDKITKEMYQPLMKVLKFWLKDSAPAGLYIAKQNKGYKGSKYTINNRNVIKPKMVKNKIKAVKKLARECKPNMIIKDHRITLFIDSILNGVQRIGTIDSDESLDELIKNRGNNSHPFYLSIKGTRELLKFRLNTSINRRYNWRPQGFSLLVLNNFLKYCKPAKPKHYDDQHDPEDDNGNYQRRITSMYETINQYTKKYGYQIMDYNTGYYNYDNAYWEFYDDKKPENWQYINRRCHLFTKNQPDFSNFNGNDVVILYQPRKYHPGIHLLKKRDIPYLINIFKNINSPYGRKVTILKFKQDRLKF